MKIENGLDGRFSSDNWFSLSRRSDLANDIIELSIIFASFHFLSGLNPK